MHTVYGIQKRLRRSNVNSYYVSIDPRNVLYVVLHQGIIYRGETLLQAMLAFVESVEITIN